MNKTTIIYVIDGMEYPLDIADLTAKETGILKEVGKIRGIYDIPEAMNSGDLEALVALVGIAMARSGITPDYGKLGTLRISDIKTKVEERPTKGASKKPAPTGIQL